MVKQRLRPPPEVLTMSTDLIDLVHRLGEPRVLVIGDLMLDRYIWGNAARISQEAPVLLLHADHREERLGGASSVATMLRALGAKVTMAGVLGADADGGRVRQMLADLGVEQDAVLSDAGRPTTVKERYIGRAQQKHPQQILRVDYERRDAIDAYVEQELAQRIASEIRRADIVLVSDYDKGVCTPGLLAVVVADARACGKRTLTDPIRGGDYSKYRGCSAITPNRLEASLATGHEIPTSSAALAAAEQLRTTLALEAAIITLDKDGMVIVGTDGVRGLYPTRPRQVYDITGAGDMVLSVLGLALASGAGYEAAIRLANVAGGLEVEKIGVATVTRDEILRDLLHDAPGGTAKKVLALDELVRELGERRRAGQRVAFTNGCFDVLHAGHVQYLHEARSQADVLVVGLNSDSGVRALKGPDRPVNAEVARSVVLAGLQAVDFVTVFDDATPIELIRAVRPDVLVKGADYRKDEVVGAEFVESYGGRVHLAELRNGFSTTGMLKRMRAA
jgi:D-beta-D-heptose 7-phosphate kinase/D-beta-D-heptose 1-phosphate adenosyltransferase